MNDISFKNAVLNQKIGALFPGSFTISNSCLGPTPLTVFCLVLPLFVQERLDLFDKFRPVLLDYNCIGAFCEDYFTFVGGILTSLLNTSWAMGTGGALGVGPSQVEIFPSACQNLQNSFGFWGTDKVSFLVFNQKQSCQRILNGKQMGQTKPFRAESSATVTSHYESAKWGSETISLLYIKSKKRGYANRHVLPPPPTELFFPVLAVCLSFQFIAASPFPAIQPPSGFKDSP